MRKTLATSSLKWSKFKLRSDQSEPMLQHIQFHNIVEQSGEKEVKMVLNDKKTRRKVAIQVWVGSNGYRGNDVHGKCINTIWGQNNALLDLTKRLKRHPLNTLGRQVGLHTMVGRTGRLTRDICGQHADLHLLNTELWFSHLEVFWLKSLTAVRFEPTVTYVSYTDMTGRWWKN